MGKEDQWVHVRWIARVVAGGAKIRPRRRLKIAICGFQRGAVGIVRRQRIIAERHPRALLATEQQAMASARDLIERSGGLSLEYSQDYWRFSTKAELRGWVETGDRFVQGIKDALVKQYGEVSISFLPSGADDME